MDYSYRQYIGVTSKQEMMMYVAKLMLIFTLATATLGIASTAPASAATFHGVGLHTLTSSNFGLTSAALGAGLDFTSTVLEVNVSAGGASATVTGATFGSCAGTDLLAGAPCDVTATNFPWEFNRTAVGTFTIDRVHIVVKFTATGVIMTLEGSISGAAINNTTHTVTLVNAPGLTATSSASSGPVTVTGDFRDDQNSLAVT